jgi:hypothetical protein
VAFKPFRWSRADLAIRAARIARGRDSQVIEPSDWTLAQSGSDPIGRLLPAEREALDEMMVSDEVVHLVASDEPIAKSDVISCQ